MTRTAIPLSRLVADDTIYGVRVVGEEREGRWEAHIEFESGSGIQLTTDVAVSSPDRASLESWAANLDRPALQKALTQASTRPIVRSA